MGQREVCKGFPGCSCLICRHMHQRCNKLCGKVVPKALEKESMDAKGKGRGTWWIIHILSELTCLQNSLPSLSHVNQKCQLLPSSCTLKRQRSLQWWRWWWLLLLFWLHRWCHHCCCHQLVVVVVVTHHHHCHFSCKPEGGAIIVIVAILVAWVVLLLLLSACPGHVVVVVVMAHATMAAQAPCRMLMSSCSGGCMTQDMSSLLFGGTGGVTQGTSSSFRSHGWCHCRCHLVVVVVTWCCHCSGHTGGAIVIVVISWWWWHDLGHIVVASANHWFRHRFPQSYNTLQYITAVTAHYSTSHRHTDMADMSYSTIVMSQRVTLAHWHRPTAPQTYKNDTEHRKSLVLAMVNTQILKMHR